MWSALGEFLFKFLGMIGLGFVMRRSGAKAQVLKDTKATLKSVRKRDATKEKVKRGGAGAARKRMRKRNG